MSTYNYNPYIMSPYGGNPMINYNNLNGCMVENIDAVKMAEVPLGGYAIFPKTDFNEIYIKSWNANGTTSILTYKLLNGQQEDIFEQINNRLDTLENKIDSLKINSNNNNKKQKESKVDNG